MKTVGFMGLGLMGAGMARRLKGAGLNLRVYNRTRAKAEEIGAAVADSPRETAEGADAVISMLPDEATAREAWLGANGALGAMKPGAVAIESGTMPVAWVKELAAAAEARGCGGLDAPVTGGPVQANSGELLFLVGGDAAVLDRVRDVLAPMSRGVRHMGPHGAGALMKLVNNYLCAVHLVSVAEAVAMIERGGLNSTDALEILANGAPGSPVVKNLGKRMAVEDYTMNFSLRWMLKDVSYADAAACETGLTLNTARTAAEALRTAIAQGLGERDLSEIIKVYRV